MVEEAKWRIEVESRISLGSPLTLEKEAKLAAKHTDRARRDLFLLSHFSLLFPFLLFTLLRQCANIQQSPVDSNTRRQPTRRYELELVAKFR